MAMGCVVSIFCNKNPLALRAMYHERVPVFIVSDCTEDQFRCIDGRCIMNQFLYFLFKTV